LLFQEHFLEHGIVVWLVLSEAVFVI